MKRAACRSDAEVSCIIANLKGISPVGEPVVIRLLPDRVLEIKGGDELLEAIRERRCPHE